MKFSSLAVSFLATAASALGSTTEGNDFPRVLTVKTTRRAATGLSEKFDILHRDSRRLQDEGPEMVELNIAVYNDAQVDYLENADGVSTQHNDELTRRHLASHEELDFEGVQGGEAFNRTLTCYRTVDEIKTSLDHLHDHYPEFVTLDTIGQTYKGEDIEMMIVTSPKNVEKADVVVTGGMHSRELPPPEALMRFTEWALEQYNEDPEMTMLLDRVRLHIVPVVNVDGRRIVEEHLDWWYRKNAHPVGCEHEHLDGVDLNRNFAMFWGWPGASNDTCSLVYYGEEALSEPEANAVSTYVTNLFPDDIKKADNHEDAYAKWEESCPVETKGLYMDVHSWGDFIIFPWTIDDVAAPDHLPMMTLASKMAMPGNYTLWGPQQDGFLYFASGLATDTAYGFDCVPSLAFELGYDGFYANCTFFEENIQPVFFEAFKTSLRSAHGVYHLPLGPDIMSISEPTVANGKASLAVEVSDGAMIVPHAVFPGERSQAVTGVKVYVDVYPGEEGAEGTDMEAEDGAFDSVDEVGVLQLDMSCWTAGRHMLYFQGTDADGNDGPVSAAFVDAPEPDESCPTDGDSSATLGRISVLAVSAIGGLLALFA